MKKIGLCSSVSAFTQQVAEDIFDKCSTEYAIFSEIAKDYINQNLIKRHEKPRIVSDIILPALDSLKENCSGTPIVVFDLDTLIHDAPVAALKQEYTLVQLKVNKDMVFDKANFIEKTMFKEYEERLADICDAVVDFDSIDYDKSITRLTSSFLN